jgi:hypothetical protein
MWGEESETQSYMAEDYGVPSFHFLMIWKCQSCVELVIAFCGDFSKLFPNFTIFSSVSTYFLTAFLSSCDPEKFSEKFVLAFCGRTIIQTKFSTVCSSLPTYIDSHHT